MEKLNEFTMALLIKYIISKGELEPNRIIRKIDYIQLILGGFDLQIPVEESYLYYIGVNRMGLCTDTIKNTTYAKKEFGYLLNGRDDEVDSQ